MRRCPFDRKSENPYLEGMDMVRLKPERKAQLDEYTRRHGQDSAAALEQVLAEALEWELQDYQGAVEGIRRGHEDYKAGRVTVFGRIPG
jgi:predicted transcriptional regulator